MNKPSIPEVASYVAGMASIGLSMSLTDVGAAVGIVIAILSFFANTIFTYRRDRREQRESDEKLARMKMQQPERLQPAQLQSSLSRSGQPKSVQNINKNSAKPQVPADSSTKRKRRHRPRLVEPGADG